MKELKIKPADKCLIITPHADDESIGCGGVLLKYPQNCSVVVLTDGSKGGDVQERLDELKNAMKFAKIQKFKNLMIKDRLVKSNLKRLEELNLSEYNFVFVPNSKEFQIDHCYILKKVKSILKFSLKTRIICYEVWSPIPNPNLYLDIDDIIDKKIGLISNYKSQIAHNDYANKIIALNKYRGLRVQKDCVETYEEIETFAQKLFPLFEIKKEKNRTIIKFFGVKIKIKI